MPPSATPGNEPSTRRIRSAANNSVASPSHDPAMSAGSASLDSDFRKLDGRIAVAGERRNDHIRIARVKVDGLGADENDGGPLLPNGVKTTELWEDHEREKGNGHDCWCACHRVQQGCGG